jgi:hypothetical protein
MADLEIIFKTKAELAGAIAAREALERQVGAAKALGQATTELEAKIARMNQTLAQHAAAGGEGGLGHFLAELGAQALKAIPGLEGFASAVGKLARGPLSVAGVGLQAAALGFKTISASIAQYAQAEAGVAKPDLTLAPAGQRAEAQKHRYAAHDVLALPAAVDPAVLRATRQAQAPMERTLAQTSGNVSAIEAATAALKQVSQERAAMETEIKKYSEALGKKGAELGDLISQLGDAMIEALDSALQKAVQATRKAEAAAARAASPQ